MKKNLVKIISVFCVFIYILFGTNFLSDIKKSSANISKAIKEEIKEEQIENNDELKIYFIDVGQADSILIKNDDNYMLIDAGNNEDGDKLVNYFKSLGINKFDYVIGTHAHEDHIGGMDDVINNFEIDKFFMPNAITTTKTFEDVLDALDNKSLSFNTPNIGDEYDLSSASFKVLYTGTNKNDLNNTSIVLKLTYKNNNFLFMGDATSTVEKEIMQSNLDSDVLKVGHHGSEYSTTKEFLDKVNPSYAIISVGKNNIYEHPKEITINKLNDKNIKTYRTDLNGTIILTSNGNDINFETMNTDTNG